MSQAKPIISVKHLRKIYRLGDEKVIALGDINLTILQGQVVCIVGTSGSGKSTLLNQLAGLEKPTKGGVFIGKTNISKLNENQLALFRQQYLGFVFQSYNLLPTMSALENVALPLIFKGVSKSKRNKAALKMLAAVGLKKRAHHRPTQMSGGQQQRVGIARAFVSHPKVVFADEPTGNLDTKTTIDVMRMMVRFARKYNQTLIIVTHDVEIADYADRVITLIDGAITSDQLHTPIYDGLQKEPQTEPLPKLPPNDLPKEEEYCLSNSDVEDGPPQKSSDQSAVQVQTTTEQNTNTEEAREDATDETEKNATDQPPVGVKAFIAKFQSKHKHQSGKKGEKS